MGKGGNANPRELKGGKAEQLTVYLYGKAVDVSKFAKLHPGGAKALRIFNKRDATEQFEMYHSPAGAPAARAPVVQPPLRSRLPTPLRRRTPASQSPPSRT